MTAAEGSGTVSASSSRASSATPFRAALRVAASTAAGSTSTATTGAKPSTAAAIATTPEPQPISRMLCGSISATSSRHRRVVACAPVPNARPGSMTTGTTSPGGRSHGGPIHSGPTRTGRWNSRQRSSQPASTSSTRAPGGASWSVYAASSISPPRSTSSKPSGKRSSQAARAFSARSAGTRIETRLRPPFKMKLVSPLSETRSLASRRSLRPACTSRRSSAVRTLPAAAAVPR